MTLGEGIGYAASALVASSFLMSSVLRLCLMNAGGAALFALYGWMIGAPTGSSTSWPAAATVCTRATCAGWASPLPRPPRRAGPIARASAGSTQAGNALPAARERDCAELGSADFVQTHSLPMEVPHKRAELGVLGRGQVGVGREDPVGLGAGANRQVPVANQVGDPEAR